MALKVRFLFRIYTNNLKIKLLELVEKRERETKSSFYENILLQAIFSLSFPFQSLNLIRERKKTVSWLPTTNNDSLLKHFEDFYSICAFYDTAKQGKIRMAAHTHAPDKRNVPAHKLIDFCAAGKKEERGVPKINTGNGGLLFNGLDLGNRFSQRPSVQTSLPVLEFQCIFGPFDWNKLLFGLIMYIIGIRSFTFIGIDSWIIKIMLVSSK